MGVSERNSVHMAKKQADYGNESITMLKGADKVRKRPGVIFGSDGLDGCGLRSCIYRRCKVRL